MRRPPRLLRLALAAVCCALAQGAGAQVLDVRAHGAACDWDGTRGTDDTRAIRAAVAAACRAPQAAACPDVASCEWGQGAGGTVLVPRGVCRVTAPISLACDGLRLLGEGRGTSVILCDLGDPAADCVTVDQAATGRGRRVTVEGITLSARTKGSARDLLHAEGATWLKLYRAGLYRAGRWGLYVGGGLDTVVEDVEVKGNGTDGVGGGLRIGRDSKGVEGTTVRATGVYAAYNDGHGVWIGGSPAVHLDRLISEFNGALGRPGLGAGVHVAGEPGMPPSVTLVTPYFQSNAGWDVEVAGREDARPFVTIINPYMIPGGCRYGEPCGAYRKRSGYGGILVDRNDGSGALIGGVLNFYQRRDMPAVKLTANAYGFAILGGRALDTAPVQYDPEHGKTVADYPGVVQGWSGEAPGGIVLEGRFGLRVGGGPVITRSLSCTARWDPRRLRQGQHAVTVVPCPGARMGGVAAASHEKSWFGAMPLTAAVSGDDQVTVTLANLGAAERDLEEGLLRVDVWLR